MGKLEVLDPAVQPAVDKAELVRRLRSALRADCLLHEREDLVPYECDGLSAHRQVPLAVALPESEDEVRQVLRICSDARVPVVARGAGTGLSGGAMPHEQGVTLALSKLKNILEIDPAARTARVQPGVRNLAENSGGVHCLKYGLTGHNVLKLRVVTIEGEVLEVGSGGLDAPGYDLLALATGSEGLLGVVTEVTVKLLPKPVKAQVVLAAFDSVVKAGDAVAQIIAAGCIPSGLEMMDKLAVGAVEQFVHAGYPLDAEAILLCECDGTSEEVAVEIERVSQVMRASGATEIRLSRDDAERLKFWSGRKAAFPAVGRILPDYYCMDGTIPKKKLGEVLAGIGALSKQFGLTCPNVFHAGDGNLHPLIMFDANVGDQAKRAEEFGAAILILCVEVGGTITG